MGDAGGPRTRRRLVLVTVLGALVLLVAGWVDARGHGATNAEQAALGRARAHLAAVQRDVGSASASKAAMTAKREQLGVSMVTTQIELGGVNSDLGDTQVHAYLQGVNIKTLQICLGGVQNALDALKFTATAQAAQDITAVAGPCSQLTGGTSAGLVYPFDFPDPDVILAGSTYYAYATNSVAGNIQIIDSTDLTHWTVVGNALPSLPSWATPNLTWAPSVALIGGQYELYYAVDPAGSTTECISVATATQPQGPFTDSSSAPLECQNGLGGSIDPSPFIDANGTVSLVWKSGGPGTSRIWSQQLAPSGTSFAPGTSPTLLLTPDQSWEGGTVEAPDLVEAGGHYHLFFSGNDWNSANYAVGVATCAGPLGPCADASPGPILASGNGMAGPGGESVFVDGSGSFWMAFHAWVPGAVGFPHSRSLYLRRLDLSGAVPAVAGPGPSAGAPAG